VEDFKSTANDELGRVKNLGHGEKPHEQHIYGVSTLGHSTLNTQQP